MHSCVRVVDGSGCGQQALAAAWPLSALVWAPLGDFCVHAGLAVLFKCLIQMSVFASLVQHLLPAWYRTGEGSQVSYRQRVVLQ